MLLEKIKELCNHNKITISELEKNLNFGNATIRKWDKAQPTVDKVLKVAQFFNVEIDYLLNSKSQLPSTEARQFSLVFDSLTCEQKNLVKCYISIIKMEVS